MYAGQADANSWRACPSNRNLSGDAGTLFQTGVMEEAT
jgi:hypothetical protein